MGRAGEEETTGGGLDTVTFAFLTAGAGTTGGALARADFVLDGALFAFRFCFDLDIKSVEPFWRQTKMAGQYGDTTQRSQVMKIPRKLRMEPPQPAIF